MQRIYQIMQNKSKLNTLIIALIVLFIFANVLLDFSYTKFQNSSFYISESLMFSSYWLLFLPLLPIIFETIKTKVRVKVKLAMLGLVMLIHLFAYPALIWVISKLFYYHTFEYWQSFNFGLSTYFIKSIIIYGFFFVFFSILNKKFQTLPIEVEEKIEKQDFLKTILVGDHNNKKLIIQVDEVLYFSANSPYVCIFHFTKKYLHPETLKSLELQLDKNKFVRIHKSYIVNLNKILSIQSRQNGDYDLMLIDNTILRLSRNYAKNFKSKFSKQHQLNVD